MPPPEQGFERIMNERYCLFLGPVPTFTNVQRVRVTADTVEDTVQEIRQLTRERGHRVPEWWIGDSATPDDVVPRLRACGLVPAERPPHEPEATAMALVEEPPPAAGVVARRVETFEEYQTASEIGNEAFQVPEAEREEWRRIARERWEVERRDDSHVATFLAFLDGRPIARATAVYADSGGLLIGGATLPDARGRGAYRALIRARWDEAVRRGTPALVVQAGRMSRPIVDRAGFQPVCKIQVLLDESI